MDKITGKVENAINGQTTDAVIGHNHRPQPYAVRSFYGSATKTAQVLPHRRRYFRSRRRGLQPVVTDDPRALLKCMAPRGAGGVTSSTERRSTWRAGSTAGGRSAGWTGPNQGCRGHCSLGGAEDAGHRCPRPSKLVRGLPRVSRESSDQSERSGAPSPV